MKLRRYQLDLIQEIRNKLSQGKKRVILCAPTGAGKTIIFSTIVSSALTKSLFTRVLILTDRVELCAQTFKALDSHHAEPKIFNAKVKTNERITSNCVVGMIETIKRRHKKDTSHFKTQLGEFDIIIIDEAHKGNFNAIFEIYPNAIYIGATATPIATSKANPLKKFWDDIAFIIDVPDLVGRGFLVQAKSFQMTGLYDESELKYDYTKGDFTDKSLKHAFSQPKVYEGITDAYNEYSRGKKTMIFCVNIEESINIANLIPNSYCIHSKTSKSDRQSQLLAFHNSKDGVMVNCGILTTGYDHPPIEVIIINRATTSLALFLQMCGRGSRLSEGKDYFTIIDMGGNVKRLDLWEAERNWIEWFFNPPKKGIGKPAPVRECDSCGAMLPAKKLKCQFCGSEIEAKEKEYAKGGQLLEVDPVPEEFKNRYIGDLSVDELFKLSKHPRYKPTYIWRVVRTKGKDELKEFQKIAGHKNGWFLRQLKEEKGFFNKIII